ncbi:MAG: AraC family transcriptional regulator [Victivallales bacterium]
MELAMLMLRNTRKTIKEIAFELNFSDPYYFSNLFKRKYGISPRKAKGRRSLSAAKGRRGKNHHFC